MLQFGHLKTFIRERERERVEEHEGMRGKIDVRNPSCEIVIQLEDHKRVALQCNGAYT